MVVGGEWFLMWQSHQWNGQEAAFKFYMAILGVLIFSISRMLAELAADAERLGGIPTRSMGTIKTIKKARYPKDAGLFLTQLALTAHRVTC